LVEWVAEALRANGGRADVLTLSKAIWEAHEADLRASGDLFYTWQYDIRWAANILRRTGRMKPAEDSERGLWELK